VKTKSTNSAKPNEQRGEKSLLASLSSNFCLLSFVIPVIVYAVTIGNNYNMDDELVTRGHVLTSKGLAGIPEILTSQYYQDAMGYAYDYRPVVLVSFAIEHQFLGEYVWASHAINVLLYGFMCFLLYRVLRKLFVGYSYILSFFITLLFAVHPVHTEVVASIKNRDEILAFIFGLLAFREAILYTTTAKLYRLLLVCLFFLLALFSKLTILPLAFIIPVILFVDKKPAYVMGVLAALLLACLVVLPKTVQFRNLLPYVFAGIGVELLFLYRKELYAFLRDKASAETDTNLLMFAADTNGKRNVFYAIITAFAVVVYAVLLYYKAPLVNVVLVTFLLLAAVVPDKKMATLNFALAILGIAGVYWVYHTNTLLGSGVILLAFYYSNATSNREKLMSVALLALLLLLPLPEYRPAIAAIIAFGFFVAHREVSRRYVVAGVFAVTALIVLFVILRYWGAMSSVIVLFALLLTGYFALQGKQKRFFSYIIYCLIALVLLAKPIKDTSARPVVESVVSVTDVVATKEMRPLEYVEAPVTTQSPLELRAGTSLVIGLRYLQKTVAPYPLSFYYGYRFIEPTSLFSVLPLVSLLLHLLLAALCLYFFFKNKLVFTALAIYLISVIAISNFFYPIPGMVAERFMLLPSLGFVMVVVVLLAMLFKTGFDNVSYNLLTVNKNMLLVVGLVFVCYTTLSFSRSLLWKDSITLMGHDIEYVSNSAQAHGLLGNHLAIESFNMDSNVQKQTEMRKQAAVHFSKALEIYPGFFNAAYYMGKVYSLLNMPDSAIAAYQKAIAIDSTNTDVHALVADLYYAQNKYAEAEPYFAKRIAVYPTDYKGYDQLSFLYFKMNEYDKSIAVNKLAASRIPNIPEPYTNLALTFKGIGQTDSARFYVKKALERSPDYPPAVKVLKELDYLGK